jgi:hypothetical protein
MKAKSEHEVAYQEMLALVSRYKDRMNAEELLAVAANMIGKLIALQDSRTMTQQRAIEIVLRNLEYGNQQMLAEIAKTRGNA